MLLVDPTSDRHAEALRVGARGVTAWDATPEAIVEVLAAAVRGYALLPSGIASAMARGQPPFFDPDWVTAEEIDWLRLLAGGATIHELADKVDDQDILDLTGKVFLASTFATSSESDFNNFGTVPSGQDAFAILIPNSGSTTADLLVTGFTGETETTVNVSSTGLGSGAQHVESQESLRFDIVTGADFSKADTPPEVSNTSNISYTSHLNAFQASFQLVQVNPGAAGTAAALNLFAYDVVGDAQGSSFPTNAIATDGSPVTILPANVHILDGAGTDITATFGGTITSLGAGVHITGLQDDYQVRFSTPGDDFDRFIVTNAEPLKGAGSNITFDLGNIKVSTLTTGSDTEYADQGAHLFFEDAGPSIVTTGASASITVSDALLHTPNSADFSGLWSVDFGPDGAGTVSYTVGATDATDSGLIDTATGYKIFLYIDTGAGPGGTDAVVGLVGNADGTPNSGGDEAFIITADPATADVSLQQDRAVYHDTNTNDTSVSFATDDLVTLTATVSDSESNADTASSTLPIGLSFTINDDVPVINSLQDLGSPTPLANTVNATASNWFSPRLVTSARKRASA